MYDHLKTPSNLSLNQWQTRRIYDAIQTLGSALPCSVVTPMGPLVEVEFEVNGAPFVLPNLVVPVSTWEGLRPPIQVGTLGQVFPSAVPNGQVSGLGAGTPSVLTRAGNLSALLFVPVGNKSWAPADDPDAWIIYGPNGAIVRTSDSSSVLKVKQNEIDATSNKIILQAGGHSIVIDSTGVVIDGKVFLSHEHSGVQTGTGDTGGVV